ncbi:hypothetical protein MTR67_017337 [Solanum verrucosum]|uniref:Uncharacterized protein n=1 Tax=Solanum verrucosum TaxID=315347 RepID=A0AAF0QHS6_SOLVR|nr:hypothetical protein MTR67_017337 [Solanum verrucosum]
MISSLETKWLHSIIDIPVSSTPHEESTHKTHFRIPYTLCRSDNVEDYEKYYVPRVVSIGPFRYGLTRVEPMENFKQEAMRELLLKSTLNNQNCSSDEELASLEKVYKSVEQDLLSARHLYDLFRRDTISDSEWCQMMFLDGCFIIYFISSDKRSWFNLMKKHNRDLVWRDILLLENQFPFQVLKVLARAFKCEEFTFQLPIPPILDNYINKGFLPRRQAPDHPVHLLQYYRDLWITVLFEDDVKEEEEDDNKKEEEEDCPPFSVTELKKVGIRCSCAISDHRKVIHLKSSMLSGKLFLPQLIIDELTLSLFYNLVAFEYQRSLEYTSFGILSYLSFMSMLINREEDVKELRAREVILLNLKVSDDQVVNFFKDIVAHHDPNPQAFKDVKRQISTYFKSKNLLPLRVGYAEFKQRYFSGPWNFFVFLAVIFTADANNSRAAEVAEWLHSVIDIPSSPLGTTPHEELTQKIHFGIPHTFAESTSKEDYYKYYEPRVVSIGPIHYGKPHVAPIENFKRKAVRELAERVKYEVSIEQVYASVEQDLLSITKECYNVSRWHGISDRDWCLMMFLDGCFVIEFISNNNITTTLLVAGGTR